MKLQQETITIDLDRYYIGSVGSILGVFHAIIAYFEPNTTYNLPTPYDSFGAADILLQLLQEEQEDGS